MIKQAVYIPRLFLIDVSEEKRTVLMVQAYKIRDSWIKVLDSFE